MVNARSKIVSTKNLLLTRLRELAGERVSGEALAGALGVSRVAVWKAATALRDAGYAIDADEAGYRIDPTAEEDFLYPWEFGEQEGRFRHFDLTTSTMDRARELAARGESAGGIAGSVVVAERQSAGRGRAGRAWKSDNGGLFFTLMLRAGTPVLRYARVAVAGQLAVAGAIARLTGKDASPRWPNDVYASGKKIAGLLVELESEGDLTRRMALGIGINVNNSLEGAVSCADLCGRKVSRREVLLAVLEAFDREKPFEGGSELIGRWTAASDKIGCRVAAIDARHAAADDGKTERLFAGTFRGIDEFGRAIVETAGTCRFADAGCASLRFDERR